jgi:hypothetical protein
LTSSGFIDGAYQYSCFNGSIPITNHAVTVYGSTPPPNTFWWTTPCQTADFLMARLEFLIGTIPPANLSFGQFIFNGYPASYIPYGGLRLTIYRFANHNDAIRVSSIFGDPKLSWMPVVNNSLRPIAVYSAPGVTMPPPNSGQQYISSTLLPCPFDYAASHQLTLSSVEDPSQSPFLPNSVTLTPNLPLTCNCVFACTRTPTTVYAGFSNPETPGSFCFGKTALNYDASNYMWFGQCFAPSGLGPPGVGCDVILCCNASPGFGGTTYQGAYLIGATNGTNGCVGCGGGSLDCVTNSPFFLQGTWQPYNPNGPPPTNPIYVLE